MFYVRDLGITSAWNDTLRVGNPVRSDLVVQYMTFIREEQKKAGVLVKQAPARLDGHLKDIILQHHGEGNPSSGHSVYTVAFRTMKRGDELSRTLIQRILRLPN